MTPSFSGRVKKTANKIVSKVSKTAMVNGDGKYFLKMFSTSFVIFIAESLHTKIIDFLETCEILLWLPLEIVGFKKCYYFDS